MKTTIQLTLRRFHVVIKDQRTGEVSNDTITFDRRTLNAAGLVGQSSAELIYRHYNRQGYKVLDVGEADRVKVILNLEKLVNMAGEG